MSDHQKFQKPEGLITYEVPIMDRIDSLCQNLATPSIPENTLLTVTMHKWELVALLELARVERDHERWVKGRGEEFVPDKDNAGMVDWLDFIADVITRKHKYLRILLNGPEVPGEEHAQDPADVRKDHGGTA